VRLESNLAREGVRVDVLNAATNGATIHGVLEDVIRVTNRVPLDYAIVISGYNNHPLVPLERRYSIARNIDFYLYNVSMLHVMMKEKIGRLRGQPLDYGLYHQVVRLHASQVDEVVALFHRRLDQIASVCRERRVKLVLSSQGEVFFDAALNRLSTLDADAVGTIDRTLRSRGELYLADLDYYLQGRFNLEVRRAARDLDVPYFDGAGILERDRARLFVDEIHPGPDGAGAMAGALADFFKPLLTGVSTPS
jgi:lysophospholipase L1-like esterase